MANLPQTKHQASADKKPVLLTSGRKVMAQMRIDTLRSAVEAAGVTMAPASDQFDPEPEATEVDAGNYSRSWATPRYRTGFVNQGVASVAPRSNKLKDWFAVRWPRALSTG